MSVLRYFDQAEVRRTLESDAKHYMRLVWMDVSDFLKLASPIAARIPSDERLERIDALLESETPFSTTPYLALDVRDGEAEVMSSDGRHRVLALKGLGMDQIPVMLEVEDADVEEALDSVSQFIPQIADEDEEYPGLDEDELDERSDWRLSMNEVTAVCQEDLEHRFGPKA